MNERWPPVYDADSLISAIKELASRNRTTNFYSTAPLGSPCQGDIISLSSPQPIIDETGEAALMGGFGHWLITGNSCDLTRSHDDVPFSQIVPITAVAKENFNDDQLSKLLLYKYSRRFYLPSWQVIEDDSIRFADFTRATTIEKKYFDQVEIQASLNEHSWYLLNACLVRYLARDDGRFD